MNNIAAWQPSGSELWRNSNLILDTPRVTAPCGLSHRCSRRIFERCRCLHYHKHLFLGNIQNVVVWIGILWKCGCTVQCTVVLPCAVPIYTLYEYVTICIAQAVFILHASSIIPNTLLFVYICIYHSCCFLISRVYSIS